MSILKALAMAAALAALGFSGRAVAQDTQITTATIGLEIEILNSCSFTADNYPTIIFDTQSRALPGNKTASTELDVTCTAGTDFSISLGAGFAPDSGVRHMLALDHDSDDQIPYLLYQPPGATVLWGGNLDGSSNEFGESYSATATGTGEPPEPLVVTAVIEDGNTDVDQGLYGDQVEATLTF